MILKFVTLIIITLSTNAKANIIDRTTFNQGQITPPMLFAEEGAPKKFNPNNNLARKVGSYYFAKGEPLIIEGIVTDINDIPMEGVKINIWQANAGGYYQSKITDEQDPNFDLNFTETGTYITDTLGRFMFLTTMPGKIQTKDIFHCPHINFLLSKNEQILLNTMLFFAPISSYNCDNNKDLYQFKLSKLKRKQVEQDLYYIDSRDQALGKRVLFDIKLNYIQQTKEF